MPASVVFRDFVTAGLPGSGVYNPRKPEIRTLLEGLEANLGSRVADVIYRDEKSANTDGGTFTSGSWATRTLNTEVRNRDSMASIASNVVTLPSGVWGVAWKASAYEVDAHQARLYNVTSSAVVDTGTSDRSGASSDATTWSSGFAVVTLTDDTNFRIEHRCATTKASTGLGKAANLGATETYAEFQAWKIDEVPSIIEDVTGGAAVFKYVFSTTTTDVDPGDGKLRLNAATQNTATQIYVDLKNKAGIDISAILDTFDDSTSTIHGVVRLVAAADAERWIILTLVTLVSASGYRKFTGAVVGASSASPFVDAEDVYLVFSRTGDKGMDGNDGLAGATGSTGLQGPAGVNWRGTYSGATTYAAGDGVSSGGSSYMSILGGNLNHTPPNATWWVLIAVPAGVSEIDVAFVIGQSNAQGNGFLTDGVTPTAGPTVPTGKVLKYYSAALSDGNDPVGNTGGSFCPSFGLAYYLATGRKICFVNQALGSTGQSVRSDTGNGNWDDPSLAGHQALSATIGAGGTSYTLNDIVTVAGGTFSYKAQFQVTGVSGGVVTSVARYWPGFYTATPSNNAATTGGTGTGLTLNVTYQVPTYVYTAAIATLNTAIAALQSAGYTIARKFVLWSQGENDVFAILNSNETGAQYRSALAAMYTRLCTDLSDASLPFLMFRTGAPYTGDVASWLALRNEQETAVAANPNMIMAFRGTVTFPLRGLMNSDSGNQLHYTQDGYNEAGTSAVKALQEHGIDRGFSNRPVYPNFFESTDYRVQYLLGYGTTGAGISMDATRGGGRLIHMFSSGTAAGPGAGRFIIYDDLFAELLSILGSTGAIRTRLGAGTVQSDGSGNLSVTSDERLKNKVSDFRRGILDLAKIGHAWVFKWKPDTDHEIDGEYVSFPAQAVQLAIPEAVKTDHRGMLTLDDRPILAAAVNAILELKREIEELRGKGPQAT